jgi:hypothetical protein
MNVTEHPAAESSSPNLWERIGERISPLAAISLVFGAAALAGLDDRPLHVSPLTGFAWAVIGAVAGAIDLRRQKAPHARWFAASIAFSLGLIALVAASLVLIVVHPCGAQCL